MAVLVTFLHFTIHDITLLTKNLLLEKNYGKKLTKMYLVCLHPNNQNKSFLRYEVPDMSQEVSDLMKERANKFKDLQIGNIPPDFTIKDQNGKNRSE